MAARNQLVLIQVVTIEIQLTLSHRLLGRLHERMVTPCLIDGGVETVAGQVYGEKRNQRQGRWHSMDMQDP